MNFSKKPVFEKITKAKEGIVKMTDTLVQPLPPEIELETAAVLRELVQAHRHLAEPLIIHPVLNLQFLESVAKSCYGVQL